MQRLHPLLLMQQPAHIFEDSHPDSCATRNELLSDQVLDLTKRRIHDGLCNRSKSLAIP